MSTQWLSIKEKQKILSTPDRRATKNGGLRDYCILDVLFNAGLRKGEVCGLNVGDFQRDGNGAYYLNVRSLKKRGNEKGKVRQIPLKDSTVQNLMKHLDAEYDKAHIETTLPMFRTLGKYGPHKKNRITPMAIHWLVKKYSKLAGIDKNISSHSFRHSFATHLLVDKKVDLRTVQNLMGHENISSTQIYLHSDAIKMREAIELL